MRVHEPSEKTEEGSNEIDNQDGTGQLPRWNGRPERTIGTGDEDEPVLGQGDFEEENFIEITKVLNDTSILVGLGSVVVNEQGSKGDPGTDGENDTEENGHTPEFWKVPLDWSLGERSIVIGDSQGGDISENGDEDDQVKIEGVVHDGDPETQEDFQVKRQCNTVNDVCVHTMENLTRSLESVNDS